MAIVMRYAFGVLFLSVAAPDTAVRLAIHSYVLHLHYALTTTATLTACSTTIWEARAIQHSGQY
jgi:hypothetical protein